MKRILLILCSLAVLSAGAAIGADKPGVPLQKFYGKLMSVNLDNNDLTVFNKSKKLGSDFKLDPDLKVVLKKKFIPKTELQKGQNLIVYYTTNIDQKIAKRITVRGAPTRKEAKTN